MRSFDTGKDKITKICEVLKKETLDPAKQEADQIIQEAKEHAKRIIKQAKEEAKCIEDDHKEKMKEERNIFQASIHLACKKTLGMFKQEIEHALFDQQLASALKKETRDANIIAQLISAIIKGIEKEGIDGDLRALIPETVSPRAVAKELSLEILKRLKDGAIELGEMAGGAAVKLIDDKITLDVSDDALAGLIASFVREDFRSMIFQSI